MKKKIICTSLLFYFGVSYAFGQCKALWHDEGVYEVVFEDNFDYASTSDPAFQANWHVLDTNEGWGREFYRPEQVSIVAGNLVLTADKDIQTFGTKEKYYRSGGVSIKNQVDPKINTWDTTGFYYGVLEFNVIIPTGNYDVADMWPALWTFSGGGTEIDLVDRIVNGDSILSSVLDWKEAPSIWLPSLWDTVSVTPGVDYFEHNHVYNDGDIVKSGGHYFKNISGRDIECEQHSFITSQKHWNTGENYSTMFNRIAVSWEPSKVTFYVNDREIGTINSDQVPTYKKTSNVIMTLQASWQGKWEGIMQDYMIIDYVKIYKPIGHDEDVSPYPEYKTEEEYMYTDISSSADGYSLVHSDPNSILCNPDNSNEVFYRGTDNQLYSAILQPDGSWVVTDLAPGYAYSVGDKVLGDLIFSEHKLIYKGQNQRIQCFARPMGTWVHWYIDDDWGTWDHYASTEAGALAVNSSGAIFYQGWDNKLHRFEWSGVLNDWVWTRIPYSYAPNEYIDGDVVIGGTSQVFYKGEDDRIQNFYFSGGVYNHGYVDNSGGTAYKVSDFSNRLTISNEDKLYYVGQDRKIHTFYWDGGWIHSYLDNWNAPNPSYINGTGNFNYHKSSFAGAAPFLDPNDPTNNTIYYFGMDGRLQQLKNDAGILNHSWIDDYWNTDYHAAFLSPYFTTNTASVDIMPNGTIVFAQYQGKLSSLKIDACENLNPGDDRFGYVDLRMPNVTGEGEQFETDIEPLYLENNLKLFPNPATDHVNMISSQEDIQHVVVYSVSGVMIFEEKDIDAKNYDLNLLNLSEGIYLVSILVESGEIQEKLVIK